MVYVRVEIDEGEVLDELSDSVVLAEANRRKLSVEDPRQAVSVAIAQIRRGDCLDAITTLEREFWPKWESVFDSHAAYEIATNPHVQPLKDGTDAGNMFAKALGYQIAAANNAKMAAVKPVAEGA